MEDINLMYAMTSFVITVTAVIVGVVFGYTVAVSNKQTHGNHKVDLMAGDEGDD